MASDLDFIKKHTIVVADTGDFQSIKGLGVRDSTTNPSLILQAVQKPEYKHLLQQAVDMAENKDDSSEIVDCLLVVFASEITKLLPAEGRVSVEVDARLSFDTEATIAKARSIIARLEAHGIPRSKILIKIASTWEGLQAGIALEKEGIHCNLTLLFSIAQAAVAGHGGVTLVSPFVGRILDYYKSVAPDADYSGASDPGVQSVTAIFNYFKKNSIQTQIMGASFRSVSEIKELVGCDLLTIAPKLLEELAGSDSGLTVKLDAAKAKQADVPSIKVDEKSFRWMMNEDAMATNKLAEGIRKFTVDILKLESMIKSMK
ncbi:Transaldolase [Carpediemonas membranifera]|uniref:transaldolase n=1 Tax=Carpediemonas membranifera TaxID=201153 RepID=A0A8J6E3T6_9EUKA|nr:Transaldolase [Carpediemonas membranifera]|eukprot:KAG9393607.1 Transaldolase [Carpediemonas membranifera]